MQEIEIIFGSVIRHFREKQGHSQEAFAEMAGVHRTYMSSIELGKVQVSIAIAERLAEALEFPLSKIWKEVERRQANQSSSQEDR
jgi:transcriptional regulator with XRE-family HTH domain